MKPLEVGQRFTWNCASLSSSKELSVVRVDVSTNCYLAVENNAVTISHYKFTFSSVENAIASGEIILESPVATATSSVLANIKALGVWGRPPTIPPTSSPTFKVGDKFKHHADIDLIMTVSSIATNADSVEINWKKTVEAVAGTGYYSISAVTNYIQDGVWIPVTNVEESPEIYRAGEAAKASALRDKRKFVADLIGAPLDKAAEEGKPANNSIFECPYEAYDTKYGDW